MKTYPLLDPWKVALEVARSVPSEDLSNRVCGIIRSRDIDSLLRACDVSPLEYHVEEFEALRQIRAIFSKNGSFRRSTADITAWNTFLAGEKRCRITNRRLDYYSRKHERLAPDLAAWLSNMKKLISSCLGDLDKALSYIPVGIRVTGGATATRSRARALPPLKVSLKQECSSALSPLISAFGKYIGEELRVVENNTNRVAMVPKNYKTDRTIACEPTGNIPFQLAMDSYIKRRLRRVGIDLSDQSRNQELSRIGSITGALATVDLSAASDSLALNTVHFLFPLEWSVFLNRFRSRFYKSDFGSGAYEKFASMGNGLTFPLETLIFWAAARSVSQIPHNVSVYGDDIIVQRECYEDLVRLLSFLGFKINTDKSFVHGPFRESCGTDWYLGRSVTPFYYRNPMTHGSEACHVVNGLIRHPRLHPYLAQVVRKYNLPLIPICEDTKKGVHCLVGTAYRLGTYKSDSQTPWQNVRFRGYVASAKIRVLPGSRSYFLWHLGKLSSSPYRGWELKQFEPSSYTEWCVGVRKPRYTWFVYRPTAVRPSTYLYLWDQEICLMDK